MAYNVIYCADLTELATRRGGSQPLIGAILGINYPLDEAFIIYEWRGTDTTTPDGYEVVASTSGDPTVGRWFRVNNAELPQVNADWLASTGPAAILNKPTIPAGQVATDWLATSGVTQILNKPTIPSPQVNVDWNAISGVTQILNKPSLSTVATSGAYSDLTGKPVLATVATTGTYADLTGKPTIPSAQVNSDWNATSGISQIINKPTFATVATSGAYTDLSGKPVLAAVATSGSYADLSGKPTLAAVATSGSYSDLSGRPTIPNAQVNVDWNSVNGVTQILNKPTLATVATTGAYSDLTGRPSLATVATSGSYTDLTNKPTIPAALSFSAPTTRTLNKATAYQATDPTKPAIVSITLGSTSTYSLSGTVTGAANIFIGATTGVATSTGTNIAKYKNAVGGALTVGLANSNASQQTYTIALPIGWYFAIIDTSTGGGSVTIDLAFDQAAN